MSALRHPDWHVFAEQKFRRRAAVVASRQVFRGEPYIILSDRVTGQHLRLSERAQDLWRMLDGTRSAQEIWAELIRRPSTAPNQTEIVEWLMHLVGAGLVLSDHELDARYLTERTTRKRSGMIEQRAASPLAIKFKLFDPDTIVRFTWPLFRPLFTRLGGLAVAVLLLSALTLAILHAEELRGSLDSLLLSQLGLLSLALAYPIMKALHELSHCFALYAFGGRVREFGVMLLIFFPVPYVEASEATALPDKRERMLVGAAGILAELSIAAIALFIWLALEPGVERALVFNFILIGSVSTILFNGNPLLKFDAYYVLADWLEMPNLAQRSGDFLGDRFLSRVIGLRQEEFPPKAEAHVLGIYGVLSIAYRMFLTFTIALIVSRWFFVIGIALAIWAVVMALVWPLMKLAKKGWDRSRAQNRGKISMVRLLVFFAILGGLAGFVPLPFSARGSGQVGLVPSAQIIASTSGALDSVAAVDGARIERGTPILQLVDPELLTRLDMLTVSMNFLTEASTRSGLGPVEQQRLQRELNVAMQTRETSIARRDALTVTAPIAGRLSWIGARPPPLGSFIARGQVLGYVVASEALELVMAMPAAYSGLARESTIASILMPDGTRLERSFERERIVDVGGQVPSELLTSGGGPVPEQPGNPGHALDTAWIAWADPGGDLSAYVGMRFDVRVDLGSATAFEQVVFHVRRLLVRVIRV